MILKFAALLTIFLACFSSPVQAIYDPRSVNNNKVGVHILDPHEIGSVPALVNSQGGDWGYVTVPIQPTDRDKNKWQLFMEKCLELHLIPIIRITTIPLGGTWSAATPTDLVDFANFLAELHWPVENRYIIIFNEVNRSSEWGGDVDPATYTQIVRNANTIFKERNADFFLLGPSLDSALPNSQTSMSASVYLKMMEQEDSQVWDYFDGWSSHSYPNPGFSAHPSRTGWQSIVSYRTETSTLAFGDKPIFVTETGWDQTQLSPSIIASYWSQAWNTWNQDKNLVAVTPFVLQGGNQFAPLSLTSSEGALNPSGLALQRLPKISGFPRLANNTLPSPTPTPNLEPTVAQPSYKPKSIVLKIENFLRALFGLQKKLYLQVENDYLVVELAGNARDWEKGLSGRDHLALGEGMLFVFPKDHIPTFWMKDMRFSLDIIWIHNGEIVSILSNVSKDDQETLYSPSSPVDMVLEVPGGWAEQKGYQAGMKVKVYD